MGVDKGGLVTPGYPDSEGRGRRRWGEQSTDFIQQVISPVFWIGDLITFIIGCASCLCFRCTNMAWRRIASHSGMSGRSCIGKTGRWQGFKISSKLEWPGSLFRAGGAPVPGGGRVLHWLPSHSQKVPQLQRNSLWRTFQFLSTSYIDINNIVQLWFIFGTPDLQFDINILVCYCWGSLRVSIYSAINGMILQYGGFCDWPREQTWTQA